MEQKLELRVNPEPVVEWWQITDEHQCLVIDDFLLNPGDVVAYAAAQEGGFAMPQRAYPGKLLPLHDGQTHEMHRFVKNRLSRAFSFLRGEIETYTQLSLTTMQPGDEEFSWIQQIPHCDPQFAEGRANYAAMIFLFDNQALGGTAFYRWKDPRFWQELTALQSENPEGVMDVLRERYETFRNPPAYTTESNGVVDLLAMVPAQFNRLICYSGDLPHSAFITDPELLSEDATRGRLTLNCFASAWPKQ